MSLDFLPELDWMTLGVFALSFGVCAVLVAFVSLVGAKEKTFEEALEEQRKRNKAAQEGGKAKKAASSTANSGSGGLKKRAARNQAKNALNNKQV